MAAPAVVAAGDANGNATGVDLQIEEGDGEEAGLGAADDFERQCVRAREGGKRKEQRGEGLGETAAKGHGERLFVVCP